jgi:hypothetical protein
MFMRVNLMCAHQLRPPQGLIDHTGVRCCSNRDRTFEAGSFRSSNQPAIPVILGYRFWQSVRVGE